MEEVVCVVEPHMKSERTLRSPRIKDVVTFLVPLVAVLTINNILWLKRNLLLIPPPWDQAFYLYRSVRYLHALSDGGPVALLREFVHLSPTSAPLFPLTALPIYLLFGTSRLAAHLTNSFYLFLLLLGIYLLGEHVYGRRAGILAAFFVATFSAVVNFSRDYLLDFPAAALVTLGMYALVRSEEFRRRPWCLGLGLLVGVTVLTRTMAGVFFVGPILYCLGRVVRGRMVSFSLVVNGVFSIGVAVLLASVWWGPNFRTAVMYLVHYGFKEGSVPYRSGGSEVFSVENVSWYFLVLVNYGVSFSYGVFFVGVACLTGARGVFRFGKNGSGRTAAGGRGGYLWMWLLVGYAILTFTSAKNENYLQALLPPVALVASGCIGGIDRRWVRQGVVVTGIAIGAFNYAGLTFEMPLIPRRWYVGPFAIISHEYPHFAWIRSKLDLSGDIEWPISDVRPILAEVDIKGGDRGVKVLVVPDHPVFNASTLRYYGEIYRYPLVFSHISDGPITRETLREFDFVLIKKGGYQGPEFTTRYNDRIYSVVLAPDSGFVSVPRIFSFPDHSEILMFRASRMFEPVGRRMKVGRSFS
jgi:hypothetical protein